MNNTLNEYTDKDYLESEVAKKKAKDDGKEISDYVESKDSALESIVSSGRKLIAGENLAGKIGGKVKDVLKRFVPLGEEIDSVTDEIGDSLKTKPEDRGNMNWIINRLKEKTTWRGIVAAFTALGVSINPEQAAAIVSLGVAIAGAFEVFFKEPQSEDA